MPSIINGTFHENEKIVVFFTQLKNTAVNFFFISTFKINTVSPNMLIVCVTIKIFLVSSGHILWNDLRGYFFLANSLLWKWYLTDDSTKIYSTVHLPWHTWALFSIFNPPSPFPHYVEWLCDYWSSSWQFSKCYGHSENCCSGTYIIFFKYALLDLYRETTICLFCVFGFSYGNSRQKTSHVCNFILIPQGNKTRLTETRD